MKKIYIFTLLLSLLSSSLIAGEPFAVTLLTSEQVLNMENGTSKTVVIGQPHKNNGYFFGYNGSTKVSTLFGASMTAGQTTAEAVAKSDEYRLILSKTSSGTYVIESELSPGTYLVSTPAWGSTEFGWTATSVSALASTSDMSADYTLSTLVRFSKDSGANYFNSQGDITKWAIKSGTGEWSVWCVYEVTGDIPEPDPVEPTPETEDVCKNVPAYRIPCGTFTAATYLTDIQVKGMGVLGELNYQPVKPTARMNFYTAQRIVVAPGGEVEVVATLNSATSNVYSVYVDLDGDGQFEGQSMSLDTVFTVPAEVRAMGRIRVRIDKGGLYSPNSDVWGVYYDFPVYFGEATVQRSLIAKVNSAGRGTITMNDGEASETVQGQFERGTTVSLKAVPAKGYGFLGWKTNRYIFSKDAEITVDMTDNKNIIAVFGNANEYTVSIIGLRPTETGGLIVNTDTLGTGDTMECSGSPEEGVDYTVMMVEGLNYDVNVSGKNLVLSYFTTDRTQLDDYCLYQLVVARGTVHYKADDTYLINTKDQDYPSDNALWKIIKDTSSDNAYYLYNIGAQKYVSSGSSYSLTDTPSSVVSINSTGNAKYPFYMKMGSNYVNVGGSYQLVIDSWSTLDAGNQFRYIYMGEDVPTGIEEGREMRDERRETSAFNLAGQRVGSDYMGIVISNGKKILHK